MDELTMEQIEQMGYEPEPALDDEEYDESQEASDGGNEY